MEIERLTMTSDKGGVAFTFDLDITCEKSEIMKILKLAEKLKEYEDLEEQGKMPCAVGDKIIKKLEEIKNPMYRKDGSLMAQKAFIRIDKVIEIVRQFMS